jgi:hypothetical protein
MLKLSCRILIVSQSNLWIGFSLAEKTTYSVHYYVNLIYEERKNRE